MYFVRHKQTPRWPDLGRCFTDPLFFFLFFYRGASENMLSLPLNPKSLVAGCHSDPELSRTFMTTNLQNDDTSAAHKFIKKKHLAARRI